MKKTQGERIKDKGESELVRLLADSKFKISDSRFKDLSISLRI
jgi:hypothetical protein